MTDDATTRLAKWVLVAVGFASLAVLLGVVVRSFVSWKALLLSLVVLVPAALLSYRLSRAERAYDRGRYGIGRRVVAERLSLGDEECDVCDTHGGNGVRRRFVKELVVDGVPVALVESGYNDYCRECFADESTRLVADRNDENSEDGETAEPVGECERVDPERSTSSGHERSE
ncbi:MULTISPECIES: hypothetical protein [unclassified Haladaptatus]|uniref:hypothetical protein n=1 Tax=unclassified Haladaptatus TaxID=2622732 RepID=UPI00209BBD43|nr:MULTISPECIES: hypothetical protein [unclassified Haladaptatus]MCO8242842.1 hypothetical protein [Haladaptatus sp. AB643]MCO8252602.1 hypothetical protein [Haladaptatus sp. AB618]